MEYQSLIAENSLKQAIECLEKNDIKMACVTDKLDRVIGTVTDGDIRRALIRGFSLTDSVASVMNDDPVVAHIGDSEDYIQNLMRVNEHRYIPVLNDEEHLERIEVENSSLRPQKKNNWVLLMAGGYGKRLRPHTDNVPKPMLQVGGAPMLEHIILSFVRSGFSRFCISVHYLAEAIIEYFGDGSRWGVQIAYVREEHPLGTAGAIGLMNENLDDPFIIMNGDILTKVDFTELLKFHENNDATVTLCVREHSIQVPYGTVDVNGEGLVALTEKPSYSFFINAGIYVVAPEIRKELDGVTARDMPDLINDLMSDGGKIAVFPIHEYWADLGGIDDFMKAQRDFVEIFE